jgi:chromosome segregation protein
MRLSRVKLIGFKSFVDPTTIELESDLVCIVGPNGCGKSNTIDAVRWVLGESSAKHLRGESMADVIFNGSTSRKPVGQASVELVFDNSDGTLGGEYASYAEISVKRLVTRDGQSHYFLNGVRCRRRDITHIFLGTGLGPRSYAIIEQGMISRLIESKPDELRHYLEETAGISKYKDRRRETELRMQHTRDNLDRLNDLRDELNKQQEKLKRQSEAAARFKVLREEERLLEAQLHALHWRELNVKAQQQQAVLAQAESKAEAHQTAITSIDNQLETLRQSHDTQSDHLQSVQSHFYMKGSEVARLEQELKHIKQRAEQFTEEQTQVVQDLAELRQELAMHRENTENLRVRSKELEPLLLSREFHESETAQRLREAENAMEAWQITWETINRDWHQVSQKAHGEQTTITHLETATVKAKERIQKLSEQLSLVQAGVLAAQLQVVEQAIIDKQQVFNERKVQLENSQQAIVTQKAANLEIQQRWDRAKDTLSHTKAELASTQALQQAALGQKDDKLNAWLTQRSLISAPRLAQEILVETGYEKAVETVLGDTLQAVCVDVLHDIADHIDSLASCKARFVQHNHSQQPAPAHSLLAKVKSSVLDLAPWLSHVTVVDDLAQALRVQSSLKAHESVITVDGVWLGQDWIRVSAQVADQQSVLVREQKIHALTQDIESQERTLAELNEAIRSGREQLEDLEMARDDAQKSLNEQHRALSESRAELQSIQKEHQQAEQRRKQIEQEIKELTQHLEADELKVKTTRQSLAQNLDDMHRLERDREIQMGLKESILKRHQETKQSAKLAHDQFQQAKIEQSQVESKLSSAAHNLDRMVAQEVKLNDREIWLNEQLLTNNAPMSEMEASLATKLVERASADDALQIARESLDSVAHALRAAENQRGQTEQLLSVCRSELEGLRLAISEIIVRRTTIEEQMTASEHPLEAIISQLLDSATAKETSTLLDTTRDRIKRLGPINLAAIDEYEATHERQAYLDAQHLDLSQALETLTNAIAKIDKETKDRFKETFDKVNHNLSTLFPSVFGGGEAYLELTGEDLLDTGITIMARPPGKRNATIHLLSGGEKTLTALALVFSLFKLNPSPFCMLDEVDAPLDDSNVGRFCNLLKEMAKSVQFIFITHNKLTMEVGEHMMGVTMKEPGVSRIVSVNINEVWNYNGFWLW